MTPVTIYRYGALSWVWRLFIAAALLSGGSSLLGGAMLGAITLVLFGIVLLAPAIYFGTVVAVRIDDVGDEFVQVETLLFCRRRLAVAQFGRPRVRTTYEDEAATYNAPRVWMPVRGQWAVYIDMLGEVPDRERLCRILGIGGMV